MQEDIELDYDGSLFEEQDFVDDLEEPDDKVKKIIDYDDARSSNEPESHKDMIKRIKGF